MTLLAPEIVEGILAARQPAGLTMARAMKPFPMGWRDQLPHISIDAPKVGRKRLFASHVLQREDINAED